MRVMGYCRVSTNEQATEGMSLDAQESRIRAWADAMDHEVVEMVTDEGVSGTKLLSDRPNGMKVAELLDARKPSVEAVVVVRMDRLGRDAAEQIALLKRFRVGKVGVVAIAQQIDLATPHGRAMAQIGAVFAELERALIAERTVEALDELRRQGKAWNHAPFGWGVHDGHLVPVPEEQETVELILWLREAGWSYDRIAKRLTADGHRTKRGGPWQAMSVRSVERTASRMMSSSL
ncbi:MAG: recombinase family protein [Acidobacteriota bacterium]|nr:recombinase family protein [Acidobacteriota bacterium]